MLKSVVVLCLSLSTSAFAATSSPAKGLSTFDVYAAPLLAPNYGSYKAGSVDKGSSLALQYGARLGFKLGPILLGGEFGGSWLSNSSKQEGMTSADKDKYAINSTGTLTQVGAHLGLKSENWILLGTFYPSISYAVKSSSTTSSGSSGSTAATLPKYDGMGYGLEISRRLTSSLYVGLYGSMREFSKMTSGSLTNSDLDPNWQSLSYGITLTYMVSLADFASLPQLFNSVQTSR